RTARRDHSRRRAGRSAGGGNRGRGGRHPSRDGTGERTGARGIPAAHRRGGDPLARPVPRRPRGRVLRRDDEAAERAGVPAGRHAADLRHLVPGGVRRLVPGGETKRPTRTSQSYKSVVFGLSGVTGGAAWTTSSRAGCSYRGSPGTGPAGSSSAPRWRG